MTLVGFGVAPTLGTAAAAKGWAPTHGNSARYGLISEVCDSNGHSSYCLALACRSEWLELVSAAGEGGPIDHLPTSFQNPDVVVATCPETNPSLI